MHQKKVWHFADVQEEHTSKDAATMTKVTCVQQVLTADSASRGDVRAFGWPKGQIMRPFLPQQI